VKEPQNIGRKGIQWKVFKSFNGFKERARPGLEIKRAMEGHNRSLKFFQRKRTKKSAFSRKGHLAK